MFCMQVPASLPSTFLRLVVHEESSVEIKLLLQSHLSCAVSKVMLLTKSLWSCPMLSTKQIEGHMSCIFNCTASRTREFLVGFINNWKAPDWSLCEVATVKPEEPTTTMQPEVSSQEDDIDTTTERSDH